jgi:signal peptidase
VIDALLLAIIALVLAAIVFARVIPAVSGGTTLVVSGPSMVPAIPLGSAIHAIPTVPERLAVGDVVSLRVGPEQAVFTHRIVRVVPRADGVWLETKGDANSDPDPALVPALAVVGRVEVTVPALGFVITLLTLPEGVMFLLGVAGSLLAVVWLLETLELDQQAALRRRRALRASDGSRGARHEAEPVAAPTAGVGEPIAFRPLADPSDGLEPPASLPPPMTPDAPRRRSDSVGDRLASIRATRARRARWEAGRARAGLWPDTVETVPVEAPSPSAITRRRRASPASG